MQVKVHPVCEYNNSFLPKALLYVQAVIAYTLPNQALLQVQNILVGHSCWCKIMKLPPCSYILPFCICNCYQSYSDTEQMSLHIQMWKLVAICENFSSKLFCFGSEGVLKSFRKRVLHLINQCIPKLVVEQPQQHRVCAICRLTLPSWYPCFYLHTSRDIMPPVCRIFLELKFLALQFLVLFKVCQ